MNPRRLQATAGWAPSLATVWLLFPLAAVVFGASIQPIGPHDYWWSVVMGRYIHVTGEIPSANLFLYTFDAQAPFLNQPWLGQWLLFYVRDTVGDWGAIMLRNVLVGATWLILLATARERVDAAKVIVGVALLAVLVSGKTYMVRTQIFAIVPFAALLWALSAYASRPLGRAWALGVLVVVAFWANVHGSFVLAPALTSLCASAVVAERALKGASVRAEVSRWAWPVGAAWVGGLLTPHGLYGYQYVVELSLLSTVSQTVTEWQPAPWNSFYGVIFLGAVSFGVLVLGACRARAPLWQVALFGATAYLAADATRNFLWFAATLVVVLPEHVSHLLERARGALGDGRSGAGEQPSAEEAAWLNSLFAIMLVMGVLVVQPISPTYLPAMAMLSEEAREEAPGAGLYTEQTPMAIAAKLKRLGLEVRIFHDQAVGGLLEFVLAKPEGEPVAFVDQRIELIPEGVWSDYFALEVAATGWEDALDEYEVGAALLSVEAQEKLVAEMEHSDNWVRVERDAQHVLFLRADTQELIRWRSIQNERAPQPPR